MGTDELIPTGEHLLASALLPSARDGTRCLVQPCVAASSGGPRENLEESGMVEHTCLTKFQVPQRRGRVQQADFAAFPSDNLFQVISKFFCNFLRRGVRRSSRK